MTSLLQQAQTAAPAGQSPAQAQAQATAAAAMSIDQVLGLNLNEASLMEGGSVFPQGKFVFQISDIDIDTYTVGAKDDTHPFAGQEAPIIAITCACLEANVGNARNAKDVLLTAEEVAELKGKEHREAVMFGNDGTPDPKKPDVIRHSGRDKLATLLSKIHGEAAYEALKAQSNGATGLILEATRGKQFACEITHNVNPNDPNKRVNSQINLFGEFVQIA